MKGRQTEACSTRTYFICECTIQALVSALEAKPSLLLGLGQVLRIELVWARVLRASRNFLFGLQNFIHRVGVHHDLLFGGEDIHRIGGYLTSKTSLLAWDGQLLINTIDVTAAGKGADGISV